MCARYIPDQCMTTNRFFHSFKPNSNMAEAEISEVLGCKYFKSLPHQDHVTERSDSGKTQPYLVSHIAINYRYQGVGNGTELCLMSNFLHVFANSGITSKYIGIL